MKKLLFSTMALGTLVAVALPASVSANEVDGKQMQDAEGNTRARQESKVGVEFGTKVVPPTDVFVGNLVMAYLPTDIDLGVHESSTSGITIANPSKAIREKNNWLVINDDRPEIEAADNNGTADKRMKEWKVIASMTELENKSDATDKLPARLTFTKTDLKEYYVGDLDTSGGVADYKHSFPGTETNGVSNLKDLDNANKFITGAWDSNSEGTFTIDGTSSTSETIVLAAKAGINPDHKAKDRNDGKRKGGQGYALSFNNPSLNVTKGQKDNSKYEGTISWLLSSGQEPIGW